MKKVILSLALLMTLALGAVAQTSNHTHRLTVTNKSGGQLVQIFLTYGGERGWGTDWLDDDELVPNNDYRVVDLPGHKPYDLKVTKSLGPDCLLRVDLQKDLEVVIYRSTCYIVN
jgi:hypothetical protein